MIKKCVVCNNKFKTYKKNQTTCCKVCGYTNRKNKTKKKRDGEYVHVREDIYKIPYLRKNGMPANTYYVKTKCTECGKVVFQHRSNSQRKASPFCSQECRSKGMSGEKNVKWAGGKKFKRGKNRGHILVYAPEHPHNRKNYIPEHRHIVEKNIGRFLKPEERVHHINMIQDDNQIENLHIFSKEEKHFLAHGSLNKCVSKLLANGILKFDKSTGEYYVAE